MPGRLKEMPVRDLYDLTGPQAPGDDETPAEIMHKMMTQQETEARGPGTNQKQKDNQRADSTKQRTGARGSQQRSTGQGQTPQDDLSHHRHDDKNGHLFAQPKSKLGVGPRIFMDDPTPSRTAGGQDQAATNRQNEGRRQGGRNYDD